MKKQESTTMSDAISLWIETMKLRQKVDETHIISSWHTIVGELKASKTRNIYVKDRKLFVYVDSSVVRNELVLEKQALLSRLNEEGGGNIIDDIIIR